MHIDTFMLRSAGTLVLLLIWFSIGYTQEVTESTPVRIMFYNVENLFDTHNDTSRNDDEFLPDGIRRWNQTRYDRKINSLYKTIIASGEWSPPAIVGFCEVENRQVLEDLVYGTYLSNYNYWISHEESPDERGIDVCLIYRKDLVEIVDEKYMIPSTVKRSDFRSRSVLYAKILILNDTLHLFVNHWPSRRGGVLAGESLRIEIASMLRNKVDSIGRTASGKAKIIITGDFNCTPDDNVMQGLINTEADNDNRYSINLINLSGQEHTHGSGTYKYSGSWEVLDQVIVSGWLLNCDKGLSTDFGGFRIFSPDFLLKSDPKYTGSTPFSTYRGYRYQGGFSDHLPVLLDLNLR